ncbi:MAG TPA: hypothetical protein VEA80_15030 [Vitreimonas sp.]|uniref:hypothetical protein n=1 Tax=Vitreimonas sp. TaxID=3069702 RepID=UPI002D278587|nr:hypothetical protein [Vitreimonas sp.]HYD88786.1 hypothetical protein [Vitreimonas sp.]
MTPAAAQSFSAAPNASFVLDFDSEDGNFSLWRATDLTGINALRARATFVRKGQHRQWAPSFAISVGSEGADASISFTAAPRSGPLMVEAALWRGGEPSAEETFLLTPAFQEPFDIHVDWTEEGLVTFTVFSRAAQAVNGYERRQVNLGQAPTTVRITGSTGEVLFEPLQLGHVAR